MWPKQHKILILVIVLVLFLCLVFIFNTGYTDGHRTKLSLFISDIFTKYICTYGDLETHIMGSDGVFINNDNTPYVLAQVVKYRRPVGLCAFPDGGSALYEYQAMHLYKLNISNQSADRLAVFDFQSSGVDYNPYYEKPFILAKNDEGFITQIATYQGVILDFVSDVVSNTIKILSEDEYKEIEKNYERIKGSFDTNSVGGYISHELERAQTDIIDPESVVYISKYVYRLGSIEHTVVSGLDWLNFE